jgi:hypothetical protein
MLSGRKYAKTAIKRDAVLFFDAVIPYAQVHVY